MLPRGGGTSQCRADREPFAGHRLLQAPEPHPRSRRAEPPLHGRARHRARRPQPPAEAARPVVSGRCLDRLARHHRRHDRQQLLRRRARCATAPCATTSSPSTPCSPTAASALRPGGAEPRRDRAGDSPLLPAGARPARARRARGRRDRGALSQGAAPRRRLQSRCAGARQADVNLAHICWSARRARSRFSTAHRAEALAAARQARGRRLPLRHLPRGDGRRAAHRQAGAHRGRAGRRDA